MDKKFELLCIFRQFVSHTCLVLVKNCRRPPRGGVSRNYTFERGVNILNLVAPHAGA